MQAVTEKIKTLIFSPITALRMIRFLHLIYRNRQRTIYLVDIDNTVANTWPTLKDRNNRLSEKERLEGLPIFIGMRYYLKSLEKDEDNLIVFFTARSIFTTAFTRTWLKSNGLIRNTNQLVVTRTAETKWLLLKSIFFTVKKIVYIDDLSHKHESGTPEFFHGVIQKVRAHATSRPFFSYLDYQFIESANSRPYQYMATAFPTQKLPLPDNIKTLKKKILFLVQVPPPLHGASILSLSLLQSEYLNSRYKIHLTAIKFARSIADIGKFNLRKIGSLFSLSYRLILDLIRNKPNIVYFTITPSGMAFIRDLPLVCILKIFRKKRIYHLHGLGIQKEYQSSRLKRRLYHWAFTGADVICLSKNHVRDIAGLPCSRTHIVNNGIAVSAYGVRKGYSQTGEKTRILFLSNFVLSKGVKRFVDILACLGKLDPHFEAVMVGADGDITKAELEAYILEKGLSDYINVHGKVTEEQTKYKYFTEADIFVYPTQNDLFPGVILEAMQCGCAILTTPTGGIPDMLENGTDGIILHEFSEEIFSMKIKELMSDKQTLKQLGEKAQENFNRKFTKEIFEKNIGNVFDQL